MSLLTHFVAADARRLRLTIVLWVSALLVEASVAHVRSFLPTMSSAGLALRVAAWPLSIGTTLLSWALVPLVLQLHPAVGSHAFWMTRPIAPRLLVTAKVVLLLVLFIGLPLAIEQVVLVINGVPAGDMTRVGLQTALHRGVFLAALAAPAALTPNLARFALLCGAALFAFALLPILAFAIDAIAGAPRMPPFGAHVSAGPGIDVPHPQPDATSQLVFFVLLMLVGLAVLALQYARRRVRDTVILAMTGLIAVVVASAYWPWPVMRASVSPPDWARAENALRLRATISAARYNPPEAMHQSEPALIVHIPLAMPSPPDGWVATASVTSASADVGGTVLTTTNEFSVGAALPDGSGEQPGPLAFQRVLQVDRLLEWGLLMGPQDAAGLMLRMPPDVVARAPTARVTGEFLVDLTKLDIASVMPLGRGSFQDGAYSVTVQDVKETPTGVLLEARISGVATVFDRRVRPRYLHFLRNTRVREAVRGVAGGGAYSVGFAQPVHMSAVHVSVAPAPGGAFSAVSETIMFDGRNPMTPDSRMLIDRDWLRDAEVVIVRATHEGTVRRTLELENLPLTPARSGS